MLSFRLANYYYGYLVVRFSGATLEKFINLCMRKSIYLWDVKRQDHFMIAKIRSDDFRRIRPLIRKAHCQAKILIRCGLPFFMYRLRRRKMLIAGGVLFCVSLYVLSSFVWFVETSGLSSLPDESILKAARQAGLRPGVMKNRVDLKQVEHALILQIPEITWAGISIKGTRAVIEVAEKTVARIKDKSPAHIVAGKDGLMEEVITLAGEAVVQRGETVRKGQTLINGVITAKVKDLSGNVILVPDAPSQLVRAQGITKARVWYQSYGEAGMLKQVRQRTGRIFTHLVLKIGVMEKIVKEGALHFDDYDIEETRKRLPFWRNKSFPVETIIITFYEVETFAVPLTSDEAREEAKRVALERLQKQLPEGAQTLSRNIEVIKTPEMNVIRVKAVIETLEDIGILQNISNTR